MDRGPIRQDSAFHKERISKFFRSSSAPTAGPTVFSDVSVVEFFISVFVVVIGSSLTSSCHGCRFDLLSLLPCRLKNKNTFFYTVTEGGLVWAVTVSVVWAYSDRGLTYSAF